MIYITILYARIVEIVIKLVCMFTHNALHFTGLSCVAALVLMEFTLHESVCAPDGRGT